MYIYSNLDSPEGPRMLEEKLCQKWAHRTSHMHQKWVTGEKPPEKSLLVES